MDRVNRRAVMAGIGGAVLAHPSIVRAQQASPVIGYLGSESPALFASRLDAFRQGLASTGFEEGRNVRIEYRWAEGDNSRLPGQAADLVRLRVNVISAPGSLASGLAAKAATTDIPVVFETGANPVAAGLVGSLNRPDGNLTGVTSLNAEVGPKRLELLHELMPAARSFSVLVNPTNPRNAEASVRDLEAAARTRALDLQVLRASAESDLEAIFASMARRRDTGLVIANETYFAMRSEWLGALAARHAVAAAHQSPEFARAGGLLGYGGDVKESHRQAGIYTGRVLKGEKPADLPIQQVTKVMFAFNLKAARQLGLAPQLSLVARADELIE